MDGGGVRGGSRCMDGREESDINQILLRYRPIAPKPVVGGSGTSGGSSTLSGKRVKRKYVRVSGSRCKKKEEGVEVDSRIEKRKIVTLQLLPERSDPITEGETELSRDRVGDNPDHRVSELLEKKNNDNFEMMRFNNNNIMNLRDNLYEARSMRVVESWVTVESVTTEACTLPENNYSDDDRVMGQLEGDMCPGFVSRLESGRVGWVNAAYRRMVGCDGRSDLRREEIVVWLEIKEEAAVVISRMGGLRAFSCWVKVRYDEVEEGRSVSMVLPCDAWRVERGGFAWRLDARAALCVGIMTDNDGCFRPL